MGDLEVADVKTEEGFAILYDGYLVVVVSPAAVRRWALGANIDLQILVLCRSKGHRSEAVPLHARGSSAETLP
jgi:hypothetical protein